MTPLASILLAACSQNANLPQRYDGPVAAAMVLPEDGGPFSVPVAFVASRRSGRIGAIDTEDGWFLSESAATPFLAPREVATGAARLLVDLVAWTGGEDRITLYAADAWTGALVEVPYSVGVDAAGAPVLVDPVVSAGPSFTDADGSGDSATLEGLVVRPGRATTEDWTIRFDGDSWSVEGSRSGPQDEPARAMTPYVTAGDELSFTITGTATAGDRIDLSIDSGVVEHDLGGTVQALQALPQAGLVAASVYDRELGRGFLVLFDPETAEVAGELPLPEDAVPWRMAAGARDEVLYVADGSQPLAWEIHLDPADPADSTVLSIDMPAPLQDLSWVGGDDYEHLFVAPAGLNEVDVYDLAAGGWLDVNPVTPEVDGMALTSPVAGLGATDRAMRLPQTTSFGARIDDRVVAIATFGGEMLFAEGSTGCLVQDESGPYGSLDATQPFVDAGDTSNPEMVADGATGRAITVSSCGGVVVSEDWTATYDPSAPGWRVKGSRHGEQQAIAYEDQRYLSDDGAVSFLIRAGALPSTAGDAFQWRTYPGLLIVNGDVNGDGKADELLEAPGRPAVYAWQPPDETGAGEVPEQPGGKVVWPVTNGDSVLVVDVSDAHVDAVLQ